MPRPYSEDLRWRAIWMKEMLGFQVDEVAAALWMSPRTIERYVSKVLNFGDVRARIIGRPANSVAMHQHVEFLIMEAVLESLKLILIYPYRLSVLFRTLEDLIRQRKLK